jgi:hypothetical protein
LTMNRCFVIQPFDAGGDYDKRYDEVLVPAIMEAELEPYRVDRDPAADVLISAIESQIAGATACVADISEDNPNVWYELGFAFAAGTEVVLICSSDRKKFPFDVQHRNIIRYTLGSPSDFASLSEKIASRLKTVRERPKKIASLTSVSQGDTLGLKEHEIAVLVTIMGECLDEGEVMTMQRLKGEMEQAGYAPVATALAVRSLAAAEFIQSATQQDHEDGYYFTGYRVTDDGAQWLSDHEELLKLRTNDAPDQDWGRPISF